MQKRFSQDAFLDGTELAERPITAPILHRYPRLEPMYADYLDRKIDHEFGA
jgi:hypothetical protein